MAVKRITYEEYDWNDAVFEQMEENAKDETVNQKGIFIGEAWFPTVEGLESLDLEHHMDKYYEFLQYFYQTDFTIPIPEYAQEYANMKTWLKKFFDSHVELYDPEDGEGKSNG